MTGGGNELEVLVVDVEAVGVGDLKGVGHPDAVHLYEDNGSALRREPKEEEERLDSLVR